MSTVYNGVESIEVGDVAADGGMGTDLAALGYTNLSSANITQEDDTVTDFNVEELDTPIFTRRTPGKKTVNFTVADPDLETFAAVFGGTVTPEDAGPPVVPATWNAPASAPTLEQSVKITLKTGQVINIPRANLSAKLNGQLGKENLFMIDIAMDILTPKKAGVAPISIQGTAA
jgi:hypothetical protein